MKHWWKVLGVLLVGYSIIGGFLMEAPDDLGILQKTIRNLHFHVPMWFTMITLLVVSYIYSMLFLSRSDVKYDVAAASFAKVAMVFGFMGMATGAFWAKHTWGQWWTNDPKLNGVAIGMLIYMAYYILRQNMDDEIKKGKFSAVYNLFAFPIFIVLIIVLPKMADNSLHPGSGDTVGFNNFDLDDNLRKVFYPAVLGWILLGTWISTLKRRLSLIEWKKTEMTRFNMILQTLLSQQADDSLLYSDGKIFVVVAVLLIIFLGIVLYLIRLERKINKLEKGNDEA